jgi:hypothetical protein
MPKTRLPNMAKNILAKHGQTKNMFSQACLSTLAEHVSTLKFFLVQSSLKNTLWVFTGRQRERIDEIAHRLYHTSRFLLPSLLKKSVP